MTETNLKKVEIIFIGLKGSRSQYKIENINLLEQFRKNNVMTKKDMSNLINIGLRSYEKITYGKTIGLKCARRLKKFLHNA